MPGWLRSDMPVSCFAPWSEIHSNVRLARASPACARVVIIPSEEGRPPDVTRRD